MPSPFHIRRAAAVIGNGGVIGYPTEAVYGLGCDPDNENAVDRLLRIKRRPREHGLIVIAAYIGQLERYFAPLDADASRRLAGGWPGPQTWLVPAGPRTPDWLTGRHATIAVRVTNHPIASALCRRCGHGLVSTSANLTGLPPARDATRLRRMLGGQLDYILCGAVGGLRNPTPIRDLMTGKTLRR